MGFGKLDMRLGVMLLLVLGMGRLGGLWMPEPLLLIRLRKLMCW